MKKQKDKRQQILQSAKKLIHKKGYSQTTLADIADHSGVTVGNIYYYFKTKEQIVQAIIEERTQRFQALAKEWEKEPNPRKRLLLFLEMPTIINQVITEKGCPVGSLLQELNKSQKVDSNIINGTINAHIEWVTDQFRLMNKGNPEILAYRFIAALQGGCLLANSLKKPEVLTSQIKCLQEELFLLDS